MKSLCIFLSSKTPNELSSPKQGWNWNIHENRYFWKVSSNIRCLANILTFNQFLWLRETIHGRKILSIFLFINLWAYYLREWMTTFREIFVIHHGTSFSFVSSKKKKKAQFESTTSHLIVRFTAKILSNRTQISNILWVRISRANKLHQILSFYSRHYFVERCANKAQ